MPEPHAAPFGTVTRKLALAMRNAGLGSTDALVMLHLLTWVDHSTDSAVVSFKQLATGCGLSSTKTVSRAIARMENAGVIAVERGDSCNGVRVLSRIKVNHLRAAKPGAQESGGAPDRGRTVPRSEGKTGGAPYPGSTKNRGRTVPPLKRECSRETTPSEAPKASDAGDAAGFASLEREKPARRFLNDCGVNEPSKTTLARLMADAGDRLDGLAVFMTSPDKKTTLTGTKLVAALCRKRFGRVGGGVWAEPSKAQRFEALATGDGWTPSGHMFATESRGIFVQEFRDTLDQIVEEAIRKHKPPKDSVKTEAA